MTRAAFAGRTLDCGKPIGTIRVSLNIDGAAFSRIGRIQLIAVSPACSGALRGPVDPEIAAIWCPGVEGDCRLPRWCMDRGLGVIGLAERRSGDSNGGWPGVADRFVRRRNAEGDFLALCPERPRREAIAAAALEP